MTKPLIRSLELSNFMCHTHFLISFDKRITCISGRNGSGKSALMIALGLIFGQRTQSLERGSSFKNLIKTGVNQAIIRAVITNTLGYKEHIYGKEIVIEKQLRLHGSRLLIGKRHNSNGIKMQQSESCELHRIIDRFRLRFDNPLNFMTQELSKKFLTVSTASQLYDFYYRGTEFKEIHEELEESLSRLKDMKKRLKQTGEQCVTLSSTLSAHIKNLEFLSVDHESKLKELEFESAIWTCNELIKKKQDLHSSLEGLKAESCKIENERYDLEELIEKWENGEVLDSEKELLNELDREIRENSLRVLNTQKQLKEVETDYEEYREMHARIEKEIASAHKRENTEYDKEALRMRAAQASKEMNGEQDALRELEKREQEMLGHVEAAREKAETTRQHISNLRRQAAYLRANATDSATESLMRKFQSVRSEIQRQGFQDEVVGPLCDYITLKDYKWYKAVSIILRNSVTTYIVFNRRDKIKLFNILKKMDLKFNISELSSKNIITDFRKPHLGVPTLLDVLNLKNPLVLNLLVISHSAERILMISDREEAYRIVRLGNPHVDSAYTLQGDRIKLNNGSLSDYKSRDDGKYWFEDRTSKLKKIEEIISRADATQESEFERVKRELFDVQVEIQRKRKYIEELRVDKNEIEQRVSFLDSITETDQVENERKISQLEKTIKALERKLEEIKYKLSEEQESTRILDAEQQRLRSEKVIKMEEARKKISELFSVGCRNSFNVYAVQNQCKAAEEELTSKLKELKEFAASLPAKSSQCVESPKKIKIACSSRTSVLRRMLGFLELEVLEEEIVKVSDELKDSAAIREERILIKEQMRRAKELPGKEETESLIQSLSKELAYYSGIRKKYEDTIMETITACEKRMKKRDEIKERKTVEAIRFFTEYTARREYAGTLTVDHESRLINIGVKVHGNYGSGSKNTLSGGERSYAAVCFLLSLWRSFLCPVKVLDEFDVFMDPANRRDAIRMLFEVINDCKMQAILITPLSMEEFRDGNCDIKVLEKVND